MSSAGPQLGTVHLELPEKTSRKELYLRLDGRMVGNLLPINLLPKIDQYCEVMGCYWIDKSLGML